MTDEAQRTLAAAFIAPKIKTFGDDDWARAATVYFESVCDNGLSRIEGMSEAFMALMVNRLDMTSALMEMNQWDWIRAEMAYTEVYRLKAFKDLPDDPRIMVCLQRALVTLVSGFPNPDLLPDGAHETR